MKREYTCEACHNTYEMIETEEWNEEKAIAEYIKLHPEVPKEKLDKDKDKAILCEDCFHEYKKWLLTLTDEKRKQIQEAYLQKETLRTP